MKEGILLVIIVIFNVVLAKISEHILGSEKGDYEQDR